MFTVVITEQAHLDNIKQYETFLTPFLNNPQIAFCRWEHSGRRLAEAVPELYTTVARHEKWRMVVVCDEEGLEKENPFDIVGYTDPEQPRDMSDDAYLDMRRQARIAAYTEAAKQPLTRLVTWLCQAPLVTGSMPSSQDIDPEYIEYWAQNQAKASLRQGIIGNDVPEVTLPTEILCVAKRCFTREPYDIQTAWSTRQELQYSRFYDWNLYFDKMRYLVFDILPQNHRNYTMDYLRFLYAVMLLAANEVPMSALNPNRVYALECQNDEQALKDLLQGYDNKLAATLAKIRAEIHRIENKPTPRLSDRDAKAIFCSKVTVPVNMLGTFNTDSLFVTDMEVGLSGDCPQKESDRWNTLYRGTRKALVRYLKMPQRALRKATVDFHQLNKADLDAAERLNVYQLEDVAEHTAEEELKMVDTHTTDSYDIDRYNKDLDAQNKRVTTVIEKRMTRKWTIALGVLALACYLIGFLPMFTSNIKAERGLFFALLFFLIGTGAMALTAYIILFFLRKPLRASISWYNGIMGGIKRDVDSSLGKYSKYLSHACNVMRGNSVMNFRKETEHPDVATIRILRKHEMDVLCVREEMRDIFSMFLTSDQADADLVNSYPYDFTRPVDFQYPVPYEHMQGSRIEFMQKGNHVEIPVDFVKCVHIRREDLYD